MGRFCDDVLFRQAHRILIDLVYEQQPHPAGVLTSRCLLANWLQPTTPRQRPFADAKSEKLATACPLNSGRGGQGASLAAKAVRVKKLGKPVSHGCVRISPKNAAALYSLVAKNGIKNTQVVLTGFTPGGEGKVASSARSRPAKAATSARVKSRYARVSPRSRQANEGGRWRRE